MEGKITSLIHFSLLICYGGEDHISHPLPFTDMSWRGRSHLSPTSLYWYVMEGKITSLTHFSLLICYGGEDHISHPLPFTDMSWRGRSEGNPINGYKRVFLCSCFQIYTPQFPLRSVQQACTVTKLDNEKWFLKRFIEEWFNSMYFL